MARSAVRRVEAYDEDVVDDIALLGAIDARDSFYAYRRFMDPDMLQGWWTYHLSLELQQFVERMMQGLRPKLVIEAPPQHGKSRGLTDLIEWVAGRHPDIRTMYASFSDDLGKRANTTIQRRIGDEPKYQQVFPGTTISSLQGPKFNRTFARNDTQIEWIGHKGSFSNVTVEGQVTGKGLDFGVIDDPLKGREAAQSKRQRDKTWNWFTDDFFSRFSDAAGLIITMTRWHIDDPAGRFLTQFPDAQLLNYPAEQVSPKERRKGNSAYDPRVVIGEPLFPEFKSKAFLAERRKLYTRASWASLYQQNPIIAGGSLFPIARVPYARHAPPNEMIKRSVRYWDKAGTADGGAYTAGVLMHLLTDGRVMVTDVQRDQLSAIDRERLIKNTANMDAARFDRVEIWIEQEPGSGGKESAERSVGMLRGHYAKADRVTGSKETRAEPYAAQWQAGNVILLVAPWNVDFVDEHETFPGGKYKDQVDAAAGAFMKVIGDGIAKYDTSQAWVDAED